MFVEAFFAYLHYVSILALAGVLLSEYWLCNEHLQPEQIRVLGRVDQLYMIVAILVLLTGLARFFWFAKGPAFYLSNVVFWLKMVLFVAIGLLSIPPTLQYIRWNKALKNGASRVATGAEISRARTFIVLQLIGLALVPLAAVMMARGVGH